MAEVLILTTPETFPPITAWQAVEITLDAEFGILHAKFKSNLGTYWTYREQDPDTLAAIKALNTANLSTKSLQRRLLERLDAKGVKVGTVSGSPDA